MELWATGSRAYCQLDLISAGEASRPLCEEKRDLTSYTKTFEADGIRADTLRAGQYRVHVKALEPARYFVGGHQDVALEMVEAAQLDGEDQQIGSEHYDQYAALISHHTPPTIKQGLFAVSGTGRIVDVSGRQSQVVNTPSGIKGVPIETKVVLPGECSQIVAGATHFVALCDGSVYTWGDPRYPAPLGRMDPESRPSDAPNSSTPGIVYDLEDLEDEEKVVKLVAGGSITAALTQGGDCYVWGTLDLGWSGRPEPLDFNVVDVATAEQLVVLITLTDDGGKEVWVRGKSRHGELGLGDHVQEVKDWTKVPVQVPADKEVCNVVAGANCVLLLVKRKSLL